MMVQSSMPVDSNRSSGVLSVQKKVTEKLKYTKPGLKYKYGKEGNANDQSEKSKRAV